ncbi:HpcH/HpaI aldolase/citrate lyase family protein [Ottowia thiooxydans]|uniref:Citrate lyase subunit beta/citryl-CoA lyase n=1 Tax=Ottowia thiooxydans TaxID=219182 RepID=A0ABV2Q961_9BURK
MMRSFLLAPANRPDLVAKFPRFGADCCVIDLEDGTPFADKVRAREMLAETVGKARNGGYHGLLTVRVNLPSSPLYLDDVAAALACDIDGIVVPKLESADELFPVAHWIRRRDAEAPRRRPRFVIGGIESIRGVLNAVAICATSPHLDAVYFGAEDFTAEMGARRTRGGVEVATARGMVVMAAKAAGVLAIDQAVVDIRDDALFTEDTLSGRDMGFDGKTCVTPGQVKLANAAYTPTSEEHDTARRLVDTYEAAMRNGIGTIDFEGKMIDAPLLKRAQKVLDLSAASCK